jgi:hypothetical protein
MGGTASSEGGSLSGGRFGAGGGGGGVGAASAPRSGGSGSQGAIIIVYTPFRPGHRLISTGDLITNSYLNEVGVTSVKFEVDTIIGVLDEVSNSDSALRITDNKIQTKGIFDEYTQFT